MIHFVLDGSEGVVEITARGIRHTIRVGVDRIAQQPEFELSTAAVALAPGTIVVLHWPATAAQVLSRAAHRMARLAEDYTFFNPRLTVQIDCFEHHAHIARSRADYRKWKPNQPPSAHWYTTDDFRRYVAACIGKDRLLRQDRTVREFVEGFAGLKSTVKQAAILDEVGLKRAKLSELVRDGDVDDERCEMLLHLMKKNTKQVKPADLGFIGKEHLLERFTSQGCQPESFGYARAPRQPGVAMEVPWTAEAAFAWGPRLKERRMILGVNWAPNIVNPFRDMGHDADGWKIGGLETVLEEARVSPGDPVIFALHVASARVHYTDPGKTALVLGE